MFFGLCFLVRVWGDGIFVSLGMGEPEILFEDNHLLAINKPFGMLSQGDDTGDLSAFDWVKEFIRVKYEKPGNVWLGLLHRLDRPVGGVMVFAKTSKAASRMSEVFRSKKVRKSYLALTEGVPSPASGSLVHFLKKLPGKNIVRAYRKPVDEAKESVLDYRLVSVVGKRALVEVLPRTGRQHQIRVQLASIRCPIVGDVKYGGASFNRDQSICLFAWRLGFVHPVRKEEVLIEAGFPVGWEKFGFSGV